MCSYITMSICRYITTSMHRYIKISIVIGTLQSPCVHYNRYGLPTCSRGLFGLCPVLLSYWALWKGMNASPLHSSSYISSHFSIGIRWSSMGQPCSVACRISWLTTWPGKIAFHSHFIKYWRKGYKISLAASYIIMTFKGLLTLESFSAHFRAK